MTLQSVQLPCLAFHHGEGRVTRRIYPVSLHMLRMSWAMLGCDTDQELLAKWYNGSTADRAKLPSDMLAAISKINFYVH